MSTNQNIIARDDDIEKAARSLKAMAHPLRLKILCIIGSERFSVQEIVEKVGTSQSNISQHLSIMRDKDILSSTKEANRVFYNIADNRIVQLIKLMRDMFCECNN